VVVRQYTNKGQVQNLESILVVVILVILITLGIFFYFKFFAKNIENTGVQLSEIKGTVLLDRITSLPEFSCGINCVDTTKLLSSKNIIESNMKYYNKLFGSNFGIKLIRFEQLYPQSKVNKECDNSDFTQGDYPFNCKTYTVYNKLSDGDFYEISTVVSLYYPHSDKFMLGMVIIGVN